jgi:hypothetical protein
MRNQDERLSPGLRAMVERPHGERAATASGRYQRAFWAAYAAVVPVPGDCISYAEGEVWPERDFARMLDHARATLSREA